MELGEAVLRLTTDKTGLESGMKGAKQAGVDMQTILAGVATAFAAATAFATKLINAWGEQEDATDRLKAAFKAQGHEASMAADAVAQLASKLQLTTRFGDETTIAAASVLEALTGMSSEMINRAIPAMQDMATAMGTDLSSAATLMARGIETGNLSIGRLKIEIDKNLTPADRFEKILGAMNQRFAGMAEALGKNTIGQLTILKGQLGELAEAGGRALKEFLVPFAQIIIPLIKNIADFASSTMDLRDAQRAVEAGTATTAQALLKWGDTAQDAKGKIKILTAELEAFKKTAYAKTIVGESTIEKMTYDIDHQKDVLAFANNQLKGYKQLQNEAAAATKDHAAVIVNHFNPSIDDMAIRWMALGKAVEKAQDYHLTFFYRADAGWNQLVNDMTKGATGIVDGWSKIVNEMPKVEAFFLPQSDLRKGIRDTAYDFQNTFNFASGIVKSAMQEIGISLAAGELSWSSVGEAGVHAIGKIVSALGDQLAAMAAADLVKAFAALASIVGAWAAPGFFSAAAIEGAGATAAWLAGAALSSARFAEGGDFVVPPGYPDDSYPMRVESGEHVSVTPAGQGGGGDMIHVVVNLDSQPILDAVTRGSRNRRVLISARGVV